MTTQAFETTIPARMDRLPWSRFHWMVVLGLGITWILDGLEVTLTGAISGVLQDPATLGLSAAEIGFIASAYVLGAVSGALGFGYLTDRWGRKKLFFLTLGVYLLGVSLSVFAWDVWSFAIFRFITGAGIGGEYSAINSAVDELIPARIRGRVDLMINGSYWIGAALGSVSTVVLLNPAYFSVDMGWRIVFAIGAVLSLFILAMRRFVPESPRWLVLRGRPAEAERVVAAIERQVEASSGAKLPEAREKMSVHPRKAIGFGEIAKAMFKDYPRRSFLGLVLMVAQAFLYNAIFFTYALVLTKFYAVPAKDTGLYLLPFAVGNFLGPVILGHWFDTVGRRRMITLTYAVSAVLLAVTGWAFAHGHLTATTQTALWTVIFFFASAAASSAYLTVSEIFPLETRGMAIAFFFAIGTGVGGVAAPWLFGTLIGTGSRMAIFLGYLGAAALMLVAAGVEYWLGVDAEGKSLEEIAPPICSRPETPSGPLCGASAVQPG